MNLVTSDTTYRGIWLRSVTFSDLELLTYVSNLRTSVTCSQTSYNPNVGLHTDVSRSYCLPYKRHCTTQFKEYLKGTRTVQITSASNLCVDGCPKNSSVSDLCVDGCPKKQFASAVSMAVQITVLLLISVLMAVQKTVLLLISVSTGVQKTVFSSLCRWLSK
jgi:hypothetical protein